MGTVFGGSGWETRRIGTADWYEIHDRARLEAALAEIEGVAPVGDGEWEWHEGSRDHRRLVAELTLESEGEHLVVETELEEDADRCGAILAKKAPGALEFVIGEERHVHVRVEEPLEAES